MVVSPFSFLNHNGIEDTEVYRSYGSKLFSLFLVGGGWWLQERMYHPEKVDWYWLVVKGKESLCKESFAFGEESETII